ncbi:hypothetical protein AA13595_0049 [Gluconacetobacter johannae DSM 13595]|nr:hypothetical protein AA13595_0049 [Gluconacetobacter johannae DSM 13595]
MDRDREKAAASGQEPQDPFESAWHMQTQGQSAVVADEADEPAMGHGRGSGIATASVGGKKSLGVR